jgi:hypothetical protein
MFSDALCLGHGTAIDADRRRGLTPRQGCSLHRLGRSAPSHAGRSALAISLFTGTVDDARSMSSRRSVATRKSAQG